MKPSTPFRRIAVAAALVTSMTVGAVGVASADDNSTPSEVPSAPQDKIANKKDKCLAAIDKRVGDLAEWGSKVGGLTKLTPATKTALQTQLTTVSTGLTTVAKPAVQAATTPDALKTACQNVVTVYRVYAVVNPQVFLTVGVDSTLTAADALRAALSTATKGAGDASVTALIDQAVATANAVQAKISPITPASYNAAPDATKALFKSARADLKSARSNLKAAGKSIRDLAKANGQPGGKPKKKGKDGEGRDDETSTSTTSTSTTTMPGSSTTTTTSTSSTSTSSTSTTTRL
jgi:hypothetical protein